MYIESFKSFTDDSFKASKGTYGWNCEFKTDNGKGRALLFDNSTNYKSPIELKEGEMFLFGIDTKPMNIGIGRLFLRKIFDYFKLDKIYLPSSENHPVWNKMATKTDISVEMGSKESIIFTIDRSQI